MKKIAIWMTGISFLLGMGACKNFEITHPDFEYTTGYFPYQFPVRTLILGKYNFDNSNDLAGQFLISTHIGGVYTNEVDRRFEIEVDHSLADSLLFSEGGDTVRVMPPSYYSLESDHIIVPKGKQSGGVRVQLNDSFFEDPQSIKLNYVIPVRITQAKGVDSVLRGNSGHVANADPRFEEEWINAPKDFTLFGVKFINEFHGNYFHFGKSEVSAGNNPTILEDSVYRAPFLENNPSVFLSSTARNQVILNTSLYSQKMKGQVDMLLTFKEEEEITISSKNGSSYSVSGYGVYKEDAFKWGNKDRDGIILKYTVSDADFTYSAIDTLVLRDRDVVMETFNPSKY